MRKNESGVMLLEAIYVIPVFLVIMILFYTVIPIFQMKDTVTKASLEAMMSMSQDPVFTEIIGYNNSTSDKASGVGDLIEKGIAQNGWLVRENSNFVDTERWYYNTKTTIEDTVYETSESDMDGAIALAVDSYIAANKAGIKLDVDAALKKTHNGWYNCGIGSNDPYFTTITKGMTDELRDNTNSYQKLQNYLAQLKVLLNKFNDGYIHNYAAVNDFGVDYHAADSSEKFDVSKFFTLKVDYWKILHFKFNLAVFKKEHYQRLYDDLSKIFEDNARYYVRETEHYSFDQKATQNVARKRFVSYLTGEATSDDVEKDEKYKAFAKRFGITKTNFDRLRDVQEKDYGFDFDSTHFDLKTGKLIMSLHYHTVYGINLFNKILPHDFVVTSTTGMWPGNKSLAEQTSQKEWITSEADKDSLPTWAEAKY
ncbi:MAG: hypothetical protein LBN08_06590 [Lactobacillales bacterium]|jgi:hypothetical protein|nr:hypothetical protein [Lactobacillales bacterium]